MRASITTRPAAEAGESEGLRFLKRIADVVCHECETRHEVDEQAAAYVITMTGQGESLEFYFDRTDVDDIDGERFRLAAMRFLERCLQVFRNHRVH